MGGWYNEFRDLQFTLTIGTEFWYICIDHFKPLGLSNLL